jgi:hypothetical protein
MGKEPTGKVDHVIGIATGNDPLTRSNPPRKLAGARFRPSRGGWYHAQVACTRIGPSRTSARDNIPANYKHRP